MACKPKKMAVGGMVPSGKAPQKMMKPAGKGRMVKKKAKKGC